MPPIKKSGRTAGRPQHAAARSGRAGGSSRQRSGRAAAPQHPGEVLAQILEDTPLPVAAKWFGISPAELSAVLAGEAPLTPELAAQAGTVFGTGSAPWLEMQAAWDEAQALKQSCCRKV